MRKLLFVFSVFVLMLGVSNQTFAQKHKKETKVERQAERKMKEVAWANKNVSNIESLNFTFVPNEVDPEFGMTKMLDDVMTDYYFTVDKNNLQIRLPYLGRFYIQPFGDEERAIDMNSRKFVYSVHTDDEINFEILVYPTDVLDIMNQDIKFIFSLNKNTGEGTLKVSSENRQDISYTGTFN